MPRSTRHTSSSPGHSRLPGQQRVKSCPLIAETYEHRKPMLKNQATSLCRQPERVRRIALPLPRFRSANARGRAVLCKDPIAREQAAINAIFSYHGIRKSERISCSPNICLMVAHQASVRMLPLPEGASPPSQALSAFQAERSMRFCNFKCFLTDMNAACGLSFSASPEQAHSSLPEFKP